jgi:hypothetical protein
MVMNPDDRCCRLAVTWHVECVCCLLVHVVIMTYKECTAVQRVEVCGAVNVVTPVPELFK